MPASLPTATVFGRRLRAARKAAGISQVDLGTALNVDEPSQASSRISKYELGQREPDQATVKALAEALNVPEAYFYSASDVLAEAILLIARLPIGQQKVVVEKIKTIVSSLGNKETE